MIKMEQMSELYWTLDNMLNQSKKNPMSISHDFNTRFRVWTKQILKNRLKAIIQTSGNPEYIKRMVSLVIDDYDRLVERSRKEYIIDQDINKYHKRNCNLFIVIIETIKLYEAQKHD